MGGWVICESESSTQEGFVHVQYIRMEGISILRLLEVELELERW